MNFVTLAVRRSRAQIYKLVSRLATPLPKADVFISIGTKPNDSSINDERHFGVPLIEDKMPEQNPVPLAIEERHQKAVELIAFLKKEIESLGNIVHEKSMSEEHKKLLEENKFLKEEVELWRAKVVALEEKQGIKQYPISSKLLANKREQPVGPFDVVDSSSSNAEGSNYQLSEKTNSKEKVEKKSAAPKKKEKTKATELAAKDDIKDIHVGRLDLRVGRIISVDKHPDADTLYVEQIDVGEERPRTVVSGLVKHIPIEQMQNRLVVALCNLKPAKMRGVLSEAMVMCASSPDKVEILNPPVNSTPGDLVTSDDFPGKPDAMLNPKKKIFEQVAPDLKTNDECVATYKLSVLKVGDKGVVKADTLTGVQIK